MDARREAWEQRQDEMTRLECRRALRRQVWATAPVEDAAGMAEELGSLIAQSLERIEELEAFICARPSVDA